MIHHVRPAVDVLFNSAVMRRAPRARRAAHRHGPRRRAGDEKTQAAGAATIAQNEETCVVYGMPRAAVELGAVDRVLPLDLIPHAILHALAGAAPKLHRPQSQFPSPNRLNH